MTRKPRKIETEKTGENQEAMRKSGQQQRINQEICQEKNKRKVKRKVQEKGPEIKSAERPK